QEVRRSRRSGPTRRSLTDGATCVRSRWLLSRPVPSSPAEERTRLRDVSVVVVPTAQAEHRGERRLPMSDNTPDDDFQEMLRRMLGGDASAFGGAGIDPEQLRNMGVDPTQMQQMMAAFQQAMSNSDGGIPWEAARTGALHVAN